MSDYIERDGRKYYEESYLVLANTNTRRAQGQLDALLAALRAVEWGGWTFPEPYSGMVPCCPECEMQECEGHSPDCIVGNALGRLT